MYEELIERLRMCQNDRCCYGCIEEKAVRNWQKVMGQAADAIEKLQADCKRKDEKIDDLALAFADQTTIYAQKTNECVKILAEKCAELERVKQTLRETTERETTLAERANQLLRERDVLLKYVPRECGTCKHYHQPNAVSWCDAPEADPCTIKLRELWEWRGVNGGDDNAD